MRIASWMMDTSLRLLASSSSLWDILDRLCGGLWREECGELGRRGEPGNLKEDQWLGFLPSIIKGSSTLFGGTVSSHRSGNLLEGGNGVAEAAVASLSDRLLPSLESSQLLSAAAFMLTWFEELWSRTSNCLFLKEEESCRFRNLHIPESTIISRLDLVQTTSR